MKYLYSLTRKGIKMKEKQTLLELAIRYFKSKGYKIIESPTLEGTDGVLKNFDLMVSKGNESHVVWIKPWKRTVGINVVINIDKASSAVGLTKPIVIAEQFSAHAKAYAHRKSVTLLTKRMMQRTLRYKH